MRLTGNELTQIKNQVISEVETTNYNESKVSVYVTLDEHDLDLIYELRLPHVVRRGLTLEVHLIEATIFNEEGDSIEIDNEELISMFTVELW